MTGKDVTTIPQVWALYKEVQRYWDKGLRAPKMSPSSSVTITGATSANFPIGPVRREPVDGGCITTSIMFGTAGTTNGSTPLIWPTPGINYIRRMPTASIACG